MGDLLDAYDRAIKANKQVTTIDAAAVEAGRTIARQIDHAVETMAGQDLTKALYLTPHLMNVLKELLATPAARQSLKDAAPGGKVAKLRALHGGKSA
jgi:hypothetical protein